MLFDPTATPGTGVRYRCPVCNRRINIKPSGRPRRFCCDACRNEFHKKATQRVSKEGRYHPSQSPAGEPRNPGKSSSKSMICQSGFGDPRSSFKPVLSLVAGPAVPIANLLVTVDGNIPPKPQLAPAERRELIRNALRSESSAHWARGGLK